MRVAHCEDLHALTRATPSASANRLRGPVRRRCVEGKGGGEQSDWALLEAVGRHCGSTSTRSGSKSAGHGARAVRASSVTNGASSITANAANDAS